MQSNRALLRFSKEFGLSVDSPEITIKLIEEINKLRGREDDAGEQ